MIKTKRIAESDAFNEFKQNRNISTAGPGNVAEANVTARLFKTKPVQGATTGIMGGVRRVLGLEESEGKKNQSAAPRDGGGAKKSSTGLGQEDRVSKQEDTEEEWEGIVTSDDNDDDDDSLDYSQFDSRLAPGSDSESDPNEPDPERPSSVESSEDEVEVEEEEDDDNEEGGEEDAEEEDATSPQSQSLSPPPKKPKSNPPPAPTTKTTFLPSLSMGGYFSGSESEPSDTEEVAPQRKNRMGQQARRALWEKKYGARANHVQKEKRQEKSNRDSGWDLRRGATGPDGRGPGKRGRGQRMDGGGGHREKGREWKPAKKQEDNNKPIHPSWEAARKAKEQKETAAYQGKKVVFD